MAHDIVLGVLRWDPQLRGFLIFLTGVIVLPGSMFLLLSTNMGAKIGFVLAAAGLSGWVFLLSIVWIIYGTGMKGNPPSWDVKEILTGDVAAHTALPAVRNFPAGWRLVKTGDPSLAPAQSSADHFLTPAAAPAEGAPKPPKFVPPFKTTQDYVTVAAYTKGGHNYLFRIGSHRVRFSIRHHLFYIKHDPHYYIIRVQPSLSSVTLAGAAPTLPAADVTQPITTVIMIRNEGSLREPNVFICLSAFLVFAVCTSFLHRRDKAIQRARGLTPLSA
jgi:hypothetical protein